VRVDALQDELIAPVGVYRDQIGIVDIAVAVLAHFSDLLARGKLPRNFVNKAHTYSRELKIKCRMLAALPRRFADSPPR